MAPQHQIELDASADKSESESEQLRGADVVEAALLREKPVNLVRQRDSAWAEVLAVRAAKQDERGICVLGPAESLPSLVYPSEGASLWGLRFLLTGSLVVLKFRGSQPAWKDRRSDGGGEEAASATGAAIAGALWPKTGKVKSQRPRPR